MLLCNVLYGYSYILILNVTLYCKLVGIHIINIECYFVLYIVWLYSRALY